MDSKKFLPNKAVAVLEAGKFGTAVANLLAPNLGRLFLYTYKPERALTAQISRKIAQASLAPNIAVTNDLKMVLRTCSIIFPVVPAAKFRGLMQEMASDLGPDHLLIHGTKRLQVDQGDEPLTFNHISTMSEVILHETPVREMGCLAGPNLSNELAQKYPAVTVVASASQKVLAIRERLLTND